MLNKSITNKREIRREEKKKKKKKKKGERKRDRRTETETERVVQVQKRQGKHNKLLVHCILPVASGGGGIN